MAEQRERTAPAGGYARLVAELPATVPFIAPEALERMSGVPIRLRLGANESPFGSSPKAVAAMREAASGTAWYGDPESRDLRLVLANRHGVPFEAISVGSGIDELLGLIARVFLNPGDAVVTSLGGYPTFNYHVAGYGGTLHFVPYTDAWQNDLDGLAEAAHRTSAKLVYLANPDNPTGTVFGAAQLAAFIDALPEQTTLVLDEAYVEFAAGLQTLPMSHCMNRVIRLRTFSKAYGLAGARIGYAVTHPDTVAAFDKVRNHFGVNRVAQAGALAALEDTVFLADVRRQVAAGQAQLTEVAHRLGYRPVPSAASFLFIPVGSADRAARTAEALLQRGVFIRVPGVAPLDEGLRVTIGTREQLSQFAEIWAQVDRELRG